MQPLTIYTNHLHSPAFYRNPGASAPKALDARADCAFGRHHLVGRRVSGNGFPLTALPYEDLRVVARARH
jgi:hypothetical protein